MEEKEAIAVGWLYSDPAVGLLGDWQSERRREQRERRRRGELEELTFEAVVFRAGPNRNHVRFRTEELGRFAQSFVGKPFLRNHDVQDVGARDGTILASGMLGDEMRQTVRLTTERGMRDFLDGVLDRFSIGWFFMGVNCSVCGKDWLRCEHYPGREYDGVVCELEFVNPEGKETSAVNAPAVDGTGVIRQLTMLKAAERSENLPQRTQRAQKAEEERVMEAEQLVGPRGLREEAHQGDVLFEGPGEAEPTGSAVDAVGDALAEVRALQAEMVARRREEMIAGSGLSGSGQAAVRLAGEGRPLSFTASLIEAQRAVEAERVEMNVVRGIRPVAGVITAGQMQTPEDRVQSALNWLFGLPSEPTPAPSMRSIRDLYQAITGDVNWYGVFNPEWAQLSANTTTLAGMVTNALNKIVRQHYDNLITYRWYEPLVGVVAHDGTTQAVQLIMVDGMANLPTVGEGAAYTEATVGDSKESMSFTKRGHYVGITLEAIRKSDIQRMQAIPREMVKASIRARSAAISSVFTDNSGAGPTLADDSKALFHTDHGNLATAALDATGWAGARTKIWEQTVPGTGKPLGLWPTFCLVPIELYDAALTLFGYGYGDVGKPNSAGTAQEVNPYAQPRLGDPRPVPVAVPDWTDANDWAYLVDPRLHPVIHMAYANAPQGGGHPLPEIFEVASETSGLMFTNDTLPVKVRDWWAYGVATYVGVGKNNVT